MTFSPGPASFIRGPKSASPSNTRGGSRVPEWGPLGSVRGALSNERPYRDLRNVVANNPFERSRGFSGSELNSGHGDHSRLSCRAGDAARGWVLPGSSVSLLHGRWPSCGVAERARIGRDLFRSEDDPPAAKPATPLSEASCHSSGGESLCDTFGRRRASGW